MDEVSRLTSVIMSLEETHANQIQTLKECLEAKHNQIVRLEAKVNQLSSSTSNSNTGPTTTTTTRSEAEDHDHEDGKDENPIRWVTHLLVQQPESQKNHLSRLPIALLIVLLIAFILQVTQFYGIDLSQISATPSAEHTRRATGRREQRQLQVRRRRRNGG